MRLGISFAVVLLVILHRASSAPRGILPPSAYVAEHDLSPQVPKAPADKCKNVSSSDSQRCGTKTVTHEKTVITIEKTVETEIITGDEAQRCKECPDSGTTSKAPVTTPPTTPVPCTSTTPQTPTVSTTRSTTTTTKPPTSPTAPKAPTISTTRSTTTTTKPPTSPTAPNAPTISTTRSTTTTTKPPTSRTAPKAPTVSTTPPTTTTTKPPTSPTAPPPEEYSVPCDPNKCKPPDCTCESKEPPVKDMPQFVMLTFDDAVTEANMPFYRELLEYPKRKNKVSGCRIAATFFASGEYLDYPSVNELHRMGNEIALHSISHKTDESKSYWNGLDTEGWEREVVDERTMVAKYANIPVEDMRGLRGPFLFTGGDAGFRMLHRHFDYDCTLIHKRDGPEDAPVFPYTLDYGFQKPCMVKNCPNDTYPGLWTVPLNYLFRRHEEGGVERYNHCSMADACIPTPETSYDTFEYLRFNFESFTTKRAPFPVFLHEAWLRNEERKKGYLRFVDWLLEKDDVHLVTVSEVIDFMRYPESRSSYAQRRCTKDLLPESTCPKTKRCYYPNTTPGGERLMNICGTTCPTNYPWINNPHGD